MVGQGRVCQDLRSPGDLQGLPSSWEVRLAVLEEGDLLCQEERWDHSSPGLPGTGPVMGSLGTVLQAGAHEARKDHIPELRSLGQASVPGSPRGSRGKVGPPGQVARAGDRGPCTCEEEVPCWAGRDRARSLDQENCSSSVHFLQMHH